MLLPTQRERKAESLDDIRSFALLASEQRVRGYIPRMNNSVTARATPDMIHFVTSRIERSAPTRWEDLSSKQEKLLLKMSWIPMGVWSHPLKALAQALGDED